MVIRAIRHLTPLLSKLANLKLTLLEQEQEEREANSKETTERNNYLRNLRRIKRAESLPASTPQSKLKPIPPTTPPRIPSPPFRTPSPPFRTPSPPQNPSLDLPAEPKSSKSYMAPTTEEKLFRGDYSAGEKPHIWFRRLEGKFDEDTKLTTKLYRFSKNLEPGRPAEVWFEGLKPNQKTNWDDFYLEFKVKWPLPTIVEPSREELLEKLNQTRLEIEEVGTMIERDGDRVYSHVVWAEAVKALIDVLDDTKGHLIPQVRRNLPLAIRLILPTNLTTWNAFLAAVSAISMDRLADQQENSEVIRETILQTMGINSHQYQQHNVNTLTSRLATTNFYSPVRATQPYTPKTQATQTNATAATPSTTRQALPTNSPPWTPRAPTTPIHQRFAPPISTPSGSFLSSNSTLHPNSIFSNLKTTVPQTPTHNRTTPLTNQDLARKAIAASSVFPNTQEGMTNYLTALQAWEAVYPPTREVDFTTAPYPLTPGTAPLGSRECYTCGIQGHTSKEHDPAVPQINLREQRWRAQIGRNLYARTRLDFSTISQINNNDEETLPYDPAIYDAAQLDFLEEHDEQGNGMEARE